MRRSLVKENLISLPIVSDSSYQAAAGAPVIVNDAVPQK
jgi:hypothetical protein